MVLRQSCPSKSRVDHEGTGDISLDVKISHFENEFLLSSSLKLFAWEQSFKGISVEVFSTLHSDVLIVSPETWAEKLNTLAVLNDA